MQGGGNNCNKVAIIRLPWQQSQQGGNERNQEATNPDKVETILTRWHKLKQGRGDHDKVGDHDKIVL